MKKLLLLLLLIPNLVMGDYELLINVSDDSFESTVFIDRSTIKEINGKRRVLFYSNMEGFVSNVSAGKVSVKEYIEYDCKREISLTLSTITYPKSNLEGSPSRIPKNYQEEHIIPNTVQAAVFNAVCR